MDILVARPKTTAIIQARMGSTRLPGKILMDILGEPMLIKIVNRVRAARLVDEVVVATTVLPEDDPVERLCNENKIPVYRGNALDVLNRYYMAARNCGAEIIVRLTGDNPLVDPGIIEKSLSEFLKYWKSENLDYLSTRNYPYGLNVEVFSTDALEKAYKGGGEVYEREHVTPYMYRNPNKFKIRYQDYETDLSSYRLTVDTEEDFKLIEKIFEELSGRDRIILFDDVIEMLRAKPELLKINEHVVQKNLGD